MKIFGLNLKTGDCREEKHRYEKNNIIAVTAIGWKVQDMINWGKNSHKSCAFANAVMKVQDS